MHHPASNTQYEAHQQFAHWSCTSHWLVSSNNRHRAAVEAKQVLGELTGCAVTGDTPGDGGMHLGYCTHWCCAVGTPGCSNSGWRP